MLRSCMFVCLTPRAVLSLPPSPSPTHHTLTALLLNVVVWLWWCRWCCRCAWGMLFPLTTTHRNATMCGGAGTGGGVVVLICTPHCHCLCTGGWLVVLLLLLHLPPGHSLPPGVLPPPGSSRGPPKRMQPPAIPISQPIRSPKFGVMQSPSTSHVHARHDLLVWFEICELGEWMDWLVSVTCQPNSSSWFLLL